MNNKPRKKIHSNTTPRRHFVVTDMSTRVCVCWGPLQTRQVRIEKTRFGIETLHNRAYAYVVCNTTNTNDRTSVASTTHFQEIGSVK